LLLALFIPPGKSSAQGLSGDAKLGLSIFSGGGSSTALLVGGAIDIPFQDNLLFRPEFNLTLHDGTPIEIAALLKYNPPTSGSNIPLYLVGGLGLWFYSGGSSLGMDFGAGTYFLMNEGKLKIPAEVRVGPIFESGTTVFQIALTTGVNFSLK
jgi:hypothetical protein